MTWPDTGWMVVADHPPAAAGDPQPEPWMWQAYVMRDPDTIDLREGHVASRGTAIVHAMAALHELGANR